MTYIIYMEGGSPPAHSTHSKKPLMSIAIAQLTDAQLTEIGWTKGQIKEVRKYHKVPGFQRNAHQRALCRLYSDAQRQVFAVTPDPKFTDAKKAKKAKGERGTRVTWTYEMNRLVCDLYFKWVTPHNGNENRADIVADFQALFPGVPSSNIAHAIRRIKVYDPAHPCKGEGQPSAEVRQILAEMDTRFA
jgi:hypothetical protein